ncbi:unnamed protein product, partial [Polarella glacialis]
WTMQVHKEVDLKALRGDPTCSTVALLELFPPPETENSQWGLAGADWSACSSSCSSSSSSSSGSFNSDILQDELHCLSFSSSQKKPKSRGSLLGRTRGRFKAKQARASPSSLRLRSKGGA